MTRETKIGLLVGLMFIIVIGVLLSDHLTSATEPRMADVAGVGDRAVASLQAPGNRSKYIQEVEPQDIAPRATVPASTEAVKAAEPTISVSVTGPGATAPTTDNLDVTRDAMRGHATPFSAEPGGAVAMTLGDPARTGTPGVAPTPVTPSPVTFPPSEAVTSVARPAPREYKAVAGDTVSKMAARFYGKNTQQTRDLIINANSSLKADPARVVVGKTYLIPVQASAAPVAATPLTAGSTTRPAALVAAVPAPVPTAATRVYVVKSGDNLWRIAKEQCRDANAVDAIVKLNGDVLKSSKQQLQVGMKLRLP